MEAAGDGAWTITLGGSGERGILYGFCELLDRMQTNGGRLELVPFSDRRGPAIARRGIERHWGPSLTTPDGVKANLALIRALARRRVNALLWIDNWCSPAWYPFLTMRHYPPLWRAEREAEIRTRQACLNEIINEAKRWGMEFYLSCTEFNYPASLREVSPELFAVAANGFRVLRLEQPGTWQFYRAKIREVMEVFPGLTGIELWTAEALDIHLCHRAADDTRSIPELLLEMYRQALAAMDEAGRPDARLIAATFCHHPAGENLFLELCGKMPARVEARMKMQVEDFYRYNAPSQIAGKITPGRDWVEFDLGGEHRGDWAGWITAALEYIPERMRLYADRGINSFIARIRGYSFGPDSKNIPDLDVLQGVASIKYDQYFQLCWDLAMPLETIWQRCRRPGFPDRMLEFFRLSEEVSDHAQNVMGCIVNNNHAHFLGSVDHFEYKFTNVNVVNNDCCKARAGVLEPTDANLALIVAEKEQAIAAGDAMATILEECRPGLPPADYAVLARTLAYQNQSVRVFKEHVELFFLFRLFKYRPGEGRMEKLQACMARYRAEIERLRLLAPHEARTAEMLLDNVGSRAWVECCAGYKAPKGVVNGW